MVFLPGQYTRRDVIGAAALAVVWSSFIAFLIVSGVAQETSRNREFMLGQARAFFNDIVTTREWNARHGGVYVFADQETRSNPWLDDPERDLTLPDGRMLTKINPA